MQVLWLRPDKPDNISVGRHRIGLELEARGHEVEIRNATISDFKRVIGNDPDVVIGTTRLGAFAGTWKRLLSGTPLVVDHIDPISQLRRTHGRFMNWCVSQAEKVVFRIADHVMVVYEEELPRVRRHASNVTHTSLGVDYDLFSEPPEETVESAHETIFNHIPDTSKILLYVGGLEPPYHVPAIVDAMDYLDEWHFVVLGDGKQRDWLENVSQDHDSVHYLGTVPYEEVPGYMHVADVGISLLDDPNTLKLLEYGSAKLPVVQVEGSAESVFEGLVTFCSLNPADVARAVNEAEDKYVDSLGVFAEEHRWTAIADEYETVMEHLVSD